MKHIFKIPFILFVITFFQVCYQELGIIQVVNPYTMNMQYLVIYMICIIFFTYGLYASLRDIILFIMNIKSKKTVEPHSEGI